MGGYNLRNSQETIPLRSTSLKKNKTEMLEYQSKYIYSVLMLSKEPVLQYQVNP